MYHYGGGYFYWSTRKRKPLTIFFKNQHAEISGYIFKILTTPSRKRRESRKNGVRRTLNDTLMLIWKTSENKPLYYKCLISGNLSASVRRFEKFPARCGKHFSATIAYRKLLQKRTEA